MVGLAIAILFAISVSLQSLALIAVALPWLTTLGLVSRVVTMVGGLAILVLAVAVLVSTGMFDWLLDRCRTTAPWNAGLQDTVWFDHRDLILDYPTRAHRVLSA